MTLCPGPGRANECENFGCRRNGCFGRMPDTDPAVVKARHDGYVRSWLAKPEFRAALREMAAEALARLAQAKTDAPA